MSKVKFVVIGYGHIGKRHAEMVRRNDKSELVAVCDIVKPSEVDVPYYSSKEELYNSEEFKNAEVVNICTPNGIHSEIALECIERDKHVVVEKPMGLSKKNCEDVIYSALRHHKQVFCVMQNRYSPPSEWLKSVLDQKLLGEIYMVQVNCYWNRDERYYKPGNWHGDKELDGGTLYTQFSHFIDIMYWLFGDIHNIKAKIRDFNHQELTDFEDSGIVTFDFDQGGMGVLNFSTAVYNQNLESSLTIIGEKGSIKVGGQYMNEVEYCNIKDYEMPTLAPSNPANDYGAYKGSAANHNYVIENVVDTINGSSQITTNALEGLKVVDIIERIYQAAEN